MSDQIQVSHILLMYDGSLRSTATRSQEEAKQKIEEIKAEIDGGGDFGEAAQANSDCPSSAQAVTRQLRKRHDGTGIRRRGIHTGCRR